MYINNSIPANQKIFGILLLSFISLLFTACQTKTAGTATPEEWKNLFNGKDLSGWIQLNGIAPYKVRNGAIVGTTVANSPNSFLATDQPYGDFILEFEVMLNNSINSGVQFRSQHDPTIMEGRVHGYQFELDPSDRRWTGGIYDESRRGWLYPLSLNPAAQAAFKSGSWNKARIEAIGNSITTWLNGIPVAHLLDTFASPGLIALQVHSIDKAEDAGKEIMWRNIRIKTTSLDPKEGHSAFVVNLQPNTLSDKEKKQGWKLLWDGRSNTGWRGMEQKAFPESAWQIQNGQLQLQAHNKEASGSSLMTDQAYQAFDLQLQFKLSEYSESGILYFVPEPSAAERQAISGLEYQLLHDQKPAENAKTQHPSHKLASLYGLLPAQLEARFVRPAGQWNLARIVVHPDKRVEHWLNGIQVLAYQLDTLAHLTVAASKENLQHLTMDKLAGGHMLLQNQGQPVAFRSIKLKEL